MEEVEQWEGSRLYPVSREEVYPFQQLEGLYDELSFCKRGKK